MYKLINTELVRSGTLVDHSLTSDYLPQIAPNWPPNSHRTTHTITLETQNNIDNLRYINTSKPISETSYSDGFTVGYNQVDFMPTFQVPQRYDHMSHKRTFEDEDDLCAYIRNYPHEAFRLSKKQFTTRVAIEMLNADMSAACYLRPEHFKEGPIQTLLKMASPIYDNLMIQHCSDDQVLMFDLLKENPGLFPLIKNKKSLSDNFLIQVFAQKPRLIQDFPECFSKEYAVPILDINNYAFDHFPRKIRNIKNVALKAVQTCGSHYNKLTRKLKKDLDILVCTLKHQLEDGKIIYERPNLAFSTQTVKSILKNNQHKERFLVKCFEYGVEIDFNDYLREEEREENPRISGFGFTSRLAGKNTSMSNVNIGYLTGYNPTGHNNILISPTMQQFTGQISLTFGDDEDEDQ